MVTPEPTADPLWYQGTVIYQLHIKAFADGTGDGIGDFDGLIGRLDYLANSASPRCGSCPSTHHRCATTATTSPTTPPSIRCTGRSVDSSSSLRRPTVSRPAGHHRVGHQPHLRRACLVPAGRRARKGSAERNVYVWSDTPTPYGNARHLRGLRDLELDVGSGSGPVLLAPVLRSPTRLNFDNPAVHRRRVRGDGPLAGDGSGRRPPGRHPYLYEREGANLREPARDARS